MAAARQAAEADREAVATALVQANRDGQLGVPAAAAASTPHANISAGPKGKGVPLPRSTARATKVKSAATARAGKQAAKIAAQKKATLEAASARKSSRAQVIANAQQAPDGHDSGDARTSAQAAAVHDAEEILLAERARLQLGRAFVDAAAKAAERACRDSQRQVTNHTWEKKAQAAVNAAFRGEAVRRSAIATDTSDADDSWQEPTYPFKDDEVRNRMADRLRRSGFDLNDPALRPFLMRHGTKIGGDRDEDMSRVVDERTGDLRPTSPSESEDDGKDTLYQYNFANVRHYTGSQPTPGSSTSADQMTLYRRVGDVVWRVVPEGMRVPRVDGTQEAEAARLVRECTANMISCRDYLFAGLPGSKGPDIIPQTAPPRPSALAGRSQLQRRLQGMGMAVRFEPDQKIPTESEGEQLLC